ncbi:RNI-like protein [Neolentinus lepideus HHB14362 ss-1]|uniref:RNI-like protein n=1 Tax=Neolentinus lepideus HHB14362 ss-1 TaxID=1314782 RepID=A0A165PXZ7_9AGAM|nr:RNI-like protein [Neolentinus lepideus HHB14362 ss-1]
MNSVEAGLNNVHDAPTERTPLLNDSSVTLGPNSDSPTHHLPFVETAVTRVRTLKPGEVGSADINVDASLGRTARTAFTLIVLLELRCSIQRESHDSLGILQQWSLRNARSRDTDDLDRRICQTFQYILEESGSNDEDLLSVLLLEFPYTRNSARVIRVIDILIHKNVPTKFLSHPVIMFSLLSVWNRGLPPVIHGSVNTFTERLYYRFTRICPPRGIFLILYSAASLVRSWSMSVLSAAMVFVPFISCLPAVPYPGDNAFDVLLLGLSLHILALHLPHAPSPALLFNIEKSLPLSTLFCNAIQRVFYPALIFFLPALFITLYLLSTSLSDTFLRIQTLLGLPAPMETRAAFMALGITLLLLFISFIVLLTLLFPSIISNPSASGSQWDCYTEPVGLDARRLFVRSVAVYSTPYFFPPLINLIPFVLVRAPKMFLYVVGKKRVVFLERVEAGLWWVLSCYCIEMSKRSVSAAGSSSSRPAKRRRTGGLPAFGAATEDDIQPTQTDVPSSSVLSTRILPPDYIPLLITLCARVFVANIRMLAKDEDTWAATREWLKVVPDPMIPKIFSMLRTSCPTVLSHGFILADFMRGPSITLTDDLPGVQRMTISGVARCGTSLQELHLIGLSKYADAVFASVLPSLSGLRVLNLRGCSKVAAKTVEAAQKSCPLLISLNLSYTAITPGSLGPLVVSLPDLEVLKLAGIPNWASSLLIMYQNFQMTKLRTLKLRQTRLSDHSLDPILVACPNLKRLDVSFTLIKRPAQLTGDSPPPLEKLTLTSTRISNADVVTIVSRLPQLKILALGALGGGQGSSVALANSSAMTLTDDTLRALTDVLDSFKHLEDVNLVGNTKLGLGSKQDRALAAFVRRVGRKCKRLNFANISSLRSSDLSDLVPWHADEDPPPLETLILNYTNVDDDAAAFISSCGVLATLEVQGTKFTSEGLFPIIDACPKLQRLDLTSCRGINVTDRRRFFEVWEDERH